MTRPGGICRISSLLAVALAVGRLAGGAEVTASPEGVTIRAHVTPVSEVLDELARQAGLKVIYDGPPPRDLVTVDRSSPSLAEAIPALLEGLGLSYALKMDASGTEVETLYLTAQTAPRTASSAPAGPAARTERMRQLLERRQQELQEQADQTGDYVDEAAPDEPEGPPADSFADAVAAAQEAAEGQSDAREEAQPPPQFAPSSPFTPTPFAPVPAPSQTDSNP